MKSWRLKIVCSTLKLHVIHLHFKSSMKPQSALKSSTSAGYSITPPSNFSYIEENVCRCCLPLTRTNFTFVQSVNIGVVVNVSTRKFDSMFLSYCTDKEIEVNNYLSEGELPPFNQVSLLESWTGKAIEYILAKACHNVVLIVGSPESYYDCLIIACLRRIQEWSYVSILAEFRQFTWPHKLFDLEQFIEVFHAATAADLSNNVPDFITIHDSFKEEEDKLLKRCNEGKRPDEYEDEDEAEEKAEQQRIDAILKKLFFSSKNQVISENTTYDPNLSLINDKDEED